MSGSPLTVPPPSDDDHEDVAWALRAASAQWRRDARDDAVHWVERAAETAAEVGSIDRAKELSGLARSLKGDAAMAPPPVAAPAVAPPPISSPSAVAPPISAVAARASSPMIDVEEVDVDFDVELDDGEIEELDADEELEFEDDEVTALDDDPTTIDEIPDLQGTPSVPTVEGPGQVAAASSAPAAPGLSSAPPPPSMAARAPGLGSLPSSPPPSVRLENRRTSTSPKLDRLPPSMRPVPSGLDLEEEPEDEETPQEAEFGELEFEDEVPTARVDSAPPVPDLGPVSMDGPSQIHLENETAAEYAQSRAPAPIVHDHDELERELGVNLSLRGHHPPPVVEGAKTDIDELSASKTFEDSSAFPEIDRSSHDDLAPPSASSVPPGAINEHSPVPGRASVSQYPGAPGRVSSPGNEPYSLAPSAQMPRAADIATPLPVIEPPSRPTHAPPPAEMNEPPEERPSYLPAVDSSASPSHMPPASAAPDADEFDEMFDKLSQPPQAPSVPPVDVDLSAQTSFEAPVPDLAQMVQEEEAAEAAAAAAQASTAEGAILVDGIDLMEVDGFQDLPEEAAATLAQNAQLRTLAQREEVSGFGVALVTFGAVQLMPTVADAPCRIARQGEVLFTQGTLEESAAVRVVGLEEGSRVAVFSKDHLDDAMSACPWVADELAEVADKYLAFAGAVLGPLGDSLDDMFRFMVLEKCSVKVKTAGSIIATGGKPMDGMYILGGGSLEVLAEDGSVEEELAMGDFVFPETVLSAGPASRTVRVGAGGALLLYAGRMAAHELLATCPPFIELLAG